MAHIHRTERLSWARRHRRRLGLAALLDTLLVVTSNYQLSRASLLLARCFDGEVLTAVAHP